MPTECVNAGEERAHARGRHTCLFEEKKKEVKKEATLNRGEPENIKALLTDLLKR